MPLCYLSPVACLLDPYTTSSSATWTKASIQDESTASGNQELSVDPDHRWEREIGVLQNDTPETSDG